MTEDNLSPIGRLFVTDFVLLPTSATVFHLQWILTTQSVNLFDLYCFSDLILNVRSTFALLNLPPVAVTHTTDDVFVAVWKQGVADILLHVNCFAVIGRMSKYVW